MRTLLISVFLLIFLTISCKEDDDSICTVENPAEDLPWLKQTIGQWELIKDDFNKYRYISRSAYQGNTIFIIGNCCPFCNSVLPVMNCQGEQIGIIGNREGDIPFEVMENDILIWKAVDSDCAL